MTFETICEKVSGEVEVSSANADVTSAYVGDLLSDVMAHAGENSVLITIQNHLNTIAVCSLVGIKIIVLCHNRPVPPDMAEAATREGVGIIRTSFSQYLVAMKLSELPPAEQ